MSFETVRGTRDIPPAEQPVWDLIRKAIRVTAETFCYRRVDTPIIESTELFQRGIGEATDIVNKETWYVESIKLADAKTERSNIQFKLSNDLIQLGKAGSLSGPIKDVAAKIASVNVNKTIEALELANAKITEAEEEMGSSSTLRPEGTAGVCRAFIQNGWGKSESLPLRLFYTGPMFRYERPQKGRKRQFHQFGVEVIGTDSPTADAEVVEMAVYFLQCLKIDNFKVSINSIGDTEDRQNYIETLRKFYAQYENQLSEEARATLERSPLRMLEAQSTPKLKELAQKAPEAYHKMYSQPARDHWETFLQLFKQAVPVYGNYEWEIDSKLVRGLDYYNRTVFEIAPSGATGAQSSVLGGGRYDGLIELLGGTPTPGVGFAAGLDRIYDILVATRDDIAQVAPQVVVLHDPKQGDYNAVYELAAELRRKLHKRALAAPDRSLKAQMRFASRENAEYALIVEDATANTPAKYHLKHMATGEQQTTSDKDQLFSRLRVADEQ